MSRLDQPFPARHAVILAAGESTRTRPLTLHRPKPLIPLLGRPLLAHILDELVGLVDTATLVVGYRAAMVEAAFGELYRGISLRYALQQTVNGTAGALLAAGPINEPFLLLYGDNLVAHEDLIGVCHGRSSVAGLRVADARAFGVLQIEGGHVRAILEKPANPPPEALANPGIYRFEPDVFPLLGQITPSLRGELELTDLIEALAAREPVYPHTCTGFWVPVGNPWEALTAALFLLARQAEGAASIDPSAEVAADALISGAVRIGAGVRIAAGVRISGPTWIGDGCRLGAGAVVEHAALEAGALLGPQARVCDSVLGAGATVMEAAQVQASWLDDGAEVGPGARLLAAAFADRRPAAELRGMLSEAQIITRGAVLGCGARVAGGSTIVPGTVIS